MVLHDEPCFTIHVKELELNPENNGGPWKGFKLEAKCWICILEGLHWLYLCRTEGSGKDQSKVVNYKAGEVFKERDVF